MTDKSVEQQIAEGDLTTGNFTIQAQLPLGKTITLSGYIYSKNTLEHINAQVDLYASVVERQFARAEIPVLEAKLEQKITSVQQLVEHANNLKSKQQNGKLSSAEKTQIENIFGTIKQHQDDIQKDTDALKEAKKKAQ